MTIKRKLRFATKTSGSRRIRPIAKRLDTVASDRAARMAVISQLRVGAKRPRKLLDDAQRLLTGTRWARGNCRVREELLKSVDWLIKLEHVARSHSGPTGAHRAARPSG